MNPVHAQGICWCQELTDGGGSSLADLLCVLFETRNSEIAVAHFGGICMKSQISLISQRQEELMKQLMLFSILQESLRVW